MSTSSETTTTFREACLWQEEAQRFDRMLGPFGDVALAACRPAPGDRVLDVGCGAGATTIAAARLVEPRGRAVGVDVDRGMIEVAKARALDLANVDLVVADAATFRDPAGFDVVLSRFGMMLFAEPAAAFRAIAAAARPGARIAYVTWTRPEENLWFALPYRAAGLEAPRSEAGPVGLADPDRNARLLSQAGWADVDVRPLERATWVGRDLSDALAFLRRSLTHRLDPDTMRSVLDAAAGLLEPHVRPGGVELPGVALLCTARMSRDERDRP